MAFIFTNGTDVKVFGKVPDWFIYQANGKSFEENYIDIVRQAQIQSALEQDIQRYREKREEEVEHDIEMQVEQQLPQFIETTLDELLDKMGLT